MEPEKSAPLNSWHDLHTLSTEFHEIHTEFSEESVIYTDLKVPRSSNIQKREVTRTLKREGFPWRIAAVIFAFLYLITLVIAAVLIAKVKCLEEILDTATNETAHC